MIKSLAAALAVITSSQQIQANAVGFSAPSEELGDA